MNKLHELLKNIDSTLHTNSGNVTDMEIKEAEKQLNSNFGSEMKEYLLTYGSISFNSVELYGLGFSDKYYLNIVVATKELRDMGLPMGYFPIFDIGDGHYAVVSQDDVVYEWVYYESCINRKIANSLFDYIADLIS